MNFFRSTFNLYFSGERKFVHSLKNLLGFTPLNISLYKLAFTPHTFASGTTNGMKSSNERLEYLGDAVLGMIVAEMLFKKFPFEEEGFLTEMRSKLVNRDHLGKLAKKTGMDFFITQQGNTQQLHRSTYGDAFEALIGAVYMDYGYGKAKEFILDRIIRHHVDLEELQKSELSFKSRLINWSQREKKKVLFEQFEEFESGGKKLFRVLVFVSGNEAGKGED
ncbi:MAG: ribonuclease III, partial [Bacteroidia bacterium]|nr:ribonuclease III [Bacteroidia bacterium]